MFFSLPAQLPSLGDGWTTFVELRGRYERRDDVDFSSPLSDNAVSLLSRGRIGLTYVADATSTIKLVYQLTGSDLSPTIGGGSDVQGQDLIEANIARKLGGSTLTLGRQKIAIGGQRLVGPLEWANPSRSWLGARMDSKLWTLFWGELESNPVPSPKAQVAILSHRSDYGETSMVYKHDTAPAQRTSLTTVDHRFVRSVGGIGITAEGAFQWGRRGGVDHEAWAATVRADLPVSHGAKVFAEANVATGGAGRRFDNLYPTNHPYYGMMDLQGWSNMTGFSLGASWDVNSKTYVELSYHDFSLYDETDAWIGAGGAVNSTGGVPYIDPSGASGKRIGSEIDFFARYRLNKTTTLEGGFAVFSPGEFVKSFVAGSTTQSTFGYVQVGLKF